MLKKNKRTSYIKAGTIIPSHWEKIPEKPKKPWTRFLCLPLMALFALVGYSQWVQGPSNPQIDIGKTFNQWVIDNSTVKHTELFSQPVAQAKEPVVTPTPVPQPPTTVDQMIELEFGEFGPKVVAEAKSVSMCESGKQAYNWNGKFLGVTKEQAKEEKRAVGAFQIYLKAHPKYDFDALLDGQYNVFVAKQFYKRSGWGPWLASIHCHGLR